MFFSVPLVQGLLVFLLVAANCAIVAWDAWLRHMEIPRRVHSLLAHLKGKNFHVIFYDFINVEGFR
jgi:hypothetical protein